MNWREEVLKIHERAIKRSSVEPWSIEDIRFLALALAGEVGELANLIKKHWRGDMVPHPDIDPKVVAELADIAVYHHLLCMALRINIDYAVQRKLPEIRNKFMQVLPNSGQVEAENE
jgi:NTP pyrophosphatase (non-canonical NTP hydrolase)